MAPISFLTRGERGLSFGSGNDFSSEEYDTRRAAYHQSAAIVAPQSWCPQQADDPGEDDMQTLSYSNGLSQKPGRSIATIALVGSLHLILVYAVLAALDIVPVPTVVAPSHVRMIEQKVKSAPQPPPPLH